MTKRAVVWRVKSCFRGATVSGASRVPDVAPEEQIRAGVARLQHRTDHDSALWTLTPARLQRPAPRRRSKPSLLNCERDVPVRQHRTLKPRHECFPKCSDSQRETDPRSRATGRG